MFAKFFRAPFGRAALVLGIFAILTACGGGGTSPAQQPQQVTETCPDGSKETAATSEAAKAACAQAKILSVSPADGSMVALDTFAGVTFETNSSLDLSAASGRYVDEAGIAHEAKVALAAGQKSFSVAPAAPLDPGKKYTFSATVKGSMPFRVERNNLISPWPARTDEAADA